MKFLYPCFPLFWRDTIDYSKTRRELHGPQQPMKQWLQSLFKEEKEEDEGNFEEEAIERERAKERDGRKKMNLWREEIESLLSTFSR